MDDDDANNDNEINIQLLSKNEIIVSQLRTIQVRKIKKDNTNELYSIKTNELITYMLIKDNQLLVSTIKGKIIIYVKDKDNKFIESKKICFPNNPIYLNLLDLKEKNIICGFTLDYLNIIDLENSKIISKIEFKEEKKANKKKKKKKNEEEDEESNEDDSEEMSKDSFDLHSKPFLIKCSGNNNYIICFKQRGYLTLIDSKTLKTIKKINFEKYFSFQIFKKDDNSEFFYIILFDEKDKDKKILQVHKYNNEISIVKKFKIFFKMPNIFEDEEDEEEDEENEEYSDEIKLEDFDLSNDCIYRCIIKDEKNFSFIFKRNYGETSQITALFLYNFKNGKLNKKEEISMTDANCDEIDDYVEMKELDNNRLIIAKGNYEEELKEINIINIK